MRFPIRLVTVASLAILVPATLAPPAAAAPARAAGGWVLLGQRVVTDRNDRDTIPVTRAEGTFRAVLLEVAGSAIQFRSMKIHFANGESQDVALRDVIPAGGRSRVIDVEGRDRVIRSVELAYDAQSLGGRRARIKLFGRN